MATYLAGGNTRRLRGALAPLLKAAPLSKSAVSRIVGTFKAELEAWRTRSLADLDVFGLYLDAIALRVRSAARESPGALSNWTVQIFFMRDTRCAFTRSLFFSRLRPR